jgi:hypothetical protein
VAGAVDVVIGDNDNDIGGNDGDPVGPVGLGVGENDGDPVGPTGNGAWENAAVGSSRGIASVK